MKKNRRPRMPYPGSAGTILCDVLENQGLTDKFKGYRAWTIWDQVVGPQIARQAVPLRIRSGILEVRVSQAVWMQQLQLLKPQLLARLNARLGDSPLRDIYLRRGNLPAPPEPPQSRKKTTSISDKKRSQIDKMTSEIEDDQLRTCLRRIFARQSEYNN